jgi:hypothetical protein
MPFSLLHTEEGALQVDRAPFDMRLRRKLRVRTVCSWHSENFSHPELSGKRHGEGRPTVIQPHAKKIAAYQQSIRCQISGGTAKSSET